MPVSRCSSTKYVDRAPVRGRELDLALSTLFFHHLEYDAKRRTAAELMRVIRPGGRIVVGDVGRPQDPVMRIAVGATVQLVGGVGQRD